eukprot:CAMPEP_0172030476 /NCGR_PEP_ID=MMETSP1041-20130122/18746_1 /TAXON_ID=464988 /ORGANISM="Hemiselmis andersenii, Strain CCMP439" /LENGTH=180 /DNA_ID=CAMNT_0012686831 /DNA_START=152 /DNA_END=690 /DNA_ORIENTATION=+
MSPPERKAVVLSSAALQPDDTRAHTCALFPNGSTVARALMRTNTHTQFFSQDEVWSAVKSVHPAIEIAASRSPSALPLGPKTVHSLVADHALHGVLVVGEGVTACEVNRDSLPSVQATIQRSTVEEGVSGSVVGKGANVLGNPLTSLTWLANALRKDGITLEEGAIVTTGAAALLTTDQV